MTCKQQLHRSIRSHLQHVADPAVVFTLPVRADEVGAHTVQVLRKTRRRGVRVRLGQDLRPKLERLALRPYGARHRQQNPMDLGLLLLQQSSQLVVAFDRLHRFNKDRLPR